MSGATSKLWLKYVPPYAAIQQRRDVVLRRYEILVPELNDWSVGMVELYLSRDDRRLWRTLDHWKCDWRAGFLTRESAAQDLVSQCPRTVELIATRRSRILSRGEQSGSHEVK